jgi:hypothetical protein
VLPERDHEAERGDGHAGPERTELDERTADEHQRADGDERDRQRVDGVADHGAERVDDPAADRAAVPAQVDDRGQEEPEGGQAEPDELGVLVALGPSRALCPRFFDARGRARLQGPSLTPAGRHVREFETSRRLPAVQGQQ